MSLCLLARRGTLDTSRESEIGQAIKPANNICSSQTPDRPDVPTTGNPNWLGGPLPHVFPFPLNCLHCQGFQALMVGKHRLVWGKDNQMICVLETSVFA